MEYRAEVLVEQKSVLGEGPLWIAKTNTLYYVDIKGKRINAYLPEKKKLTSLNIDYTPGCIVPVKDGSFVVAAENRLINIEADFSQHREILDLDIQDYLRFNDGKCDASGRLWAGVMATDQSISQASGGGALYRIQSGYEPIKMLNGLTIPNGLAWNNDNTIFYHIDTTKNCIDSYAFDCESGNIFDKHTVVTVSGKHGSPDGMCIDTDGMLWVAMWGGYSVCCYNPETGKKTAEIKIPAKNVSCCTFGGLDMKTLFITTAMDENGDGGELYCVHTHARGTLPFTFQL